MSGECIWREDYGGSTCGQPWCPACRPGEWERMEKEVERLRARVATAERNAQYVLNLWEFVPHELVLDSERFLEGR